MVLTIRGTIPILLHLSIFSTIPILVHPNHLIQQTKQSIINNLSITDPNINNTPLLVLFFYTLPNDPF